MTPEASPRRTSRHRHTIIITATDGRTFDVSGETVEDVLARVRAFGLTPEAVKETRHFINPADWHGRNGEA